MTSLEKSALWLCPLDGARLTAPLRTADDPLHLWPKSGPTIGACSIKASVGDHLILGRDRSSHRSAWWSLLSMADLIRGPRHWACSYHHKLRAIACIAFDRLWVQGARRGG
jgi:hypothetical protein